ncbi:hypothetical protein CR152_23945 [Massilia violaceinigra]|uniref:Uncharacterized protein n=1 Tax=Massilia violaceinigra TaxID=2045208 RepID=A0A2D2DQH0_9BURK|nr:hypothetical protein [Massilia violaceinigra]ATQ77229.1 hypothetical protein CR152_23945 [Massilia violaceinigra]
MTTAWDRIELLYENSIVDGDRRVVYKAFYFETDAKHQFGLSGECHTLLYELSEGQPDNGVEKWTWLKFMMDAGGTYAFEFKYGTPPLLERELELAKKIPPQRLIEWANGPEFDDLIP